MLELEDERIQGGRWEVLVRWQGFTAPSWEKVSGLPVIVEMIMELRARKVAEAEKDLGLLRERLTKRRKALELTEVACARKTDELNGALVRANCRGGAPPKARKCVTRPARP